MPDAGFIDALVHYRTMFRTKVSLGDGTPPDKWLSELEKVTPGAFDAVTGTGVTLEGGGWDGVRNFSQMHKVRALHARRAELDDDYVNPYTIPVEEPIAPQRIGHVVRMGC